MGIVNGSMSISRYRILGDSSFPIKALNQNLQNFVGGDLLENGLKKEVIARWVIPSGTLASTEDRQGDYWDLSDCEIDGDYLLRLRIEKRKVPGELLNLMAKKEIARLSEEKGTRLPRPVQKEIKDQLKTELIGQSLPQVSYIDVVWKWEEREVWLLSTAKNTMAQFEDLFQKTFLNKMGSSMIKIAAPLLGFADSEWSGQDQNRLDLLGQVTPSLVGYQKERQTPINSQIN